MQDMITTKDLIHIEDIFNMNYNALKEISNFIDNLESNKIKGIFEEVFNIHYENCMKCINILKHEKKEIFMEESYEDE